MINPTHPVETLLHEYRKAKVLLAAEAKKALPALLEVDHIRCGLPLRSKAEYERLASVCWLDTVDSDNDFTFESDDDYHYLSLDFIKDPEGHLEKAREEAKQREAEYKDRNLRLRNERIRTALDTLQHEGFDISRLKD